MQVKITDTIAGMRSVHNGEDDDEDETDATSAAAAAAADTPAAAAAASPPWPTATERPPHIASLQPAPSSRSNRTHAHAQGSSSRKAPTQQLGAVGSLPEPVRLLTQSTQSTASTHAHAMRGKTHRHEPTVPVVAVVVPHRAVWQALAGRLPIGFVTPQQLQLAILDTHPHFLSFLFSIYIVRLLFFIPLLPFLHLHHPPPLLHPSPSFSPSTSSSSSSSSLSFLLSTYIVLLLFFIPLTIVVTFLFH
jgi:hypothetical protein